MVVVFFAVAALGNRMESYGAPAAGRDLPLASARPGAPLEPIQVVAWGADWCKYCLKNKPELTRLSKTGKYVIIHVDFDKHREFAKRYRIFKVPTYFVVRGNIIIYRTNSIQDLKRFKLPPQEKPNGSPKHTSSK